MIDKVVSWATGNWVEILGTIFGISYVILSIKQNVLTWILGILTSVLYIYVFLNSQFYAGMVLQLYYVVVSVYGFYMWSGITSKNKSEEILHVSHLTKKQILFWSVLSVILWAVIYFMLKKLTDSPVPIGDSFVTSFGITGTLLLAKKKIENWIIWVVVDTFSVGLYFFQDMYPTSILYLIYLIGAIWGFYEWRRDYKRIYG